MYFIKYNMSYKSIHYKLNSHIQKSSYFNFLSLLYPILGTMTGPRKKRTALVLNTGNFISEKDSNNYAFSHFK